MRLMPKIHQRLQIGLHHSSKPDPSELVLARVFQLQLDDSCITEKMGWTKHEVPQEKQAICDQAEIF